ncbi:MAG: fructose-bisphosphate aldolase [Verrucomicrobia bacterium]|nr:fructose-bisphosphate aldolase [Verrucomicrobiota bacterium]
MVTSAPTSPELIARALVAPGKGILAADESIPTIGKRFKPLGIPNTEENRRAYRELLFTTPGLGEYISGAILFDETLRQMSRDALPLPAILERQGIIPGIKVDHSTTDLANFPREKITEGLDGLRGRLHEYRKAGMRFTKWRAVLVIGPDLPTRACLEANALKLAMFAALSQEADLVPIVEPEILMDGNHAIERCAEVTSMTLDAVFTTLSEHHVHFASMLLKPAMVLPGSECSTPASDEEIAAQTLHCLKRGVPPSVPGIVFLSGGQTPTQATSRLAAIHRIGKAAWALSFSFGRALQEPALNAWRGNGANVNAAQLALLETARQNGQAVQLARAPKA